MATPRRVSPHGGPRYVDVCRGGAELEEDTRLAAYPTCPSSHESVPTSGFTCSDQPVAGEEGPARDDAAADPHHLGDAPVEVLRRTSHSSNRCS